MKSMLKQPSAWVPIAASLIVFATMLVYFSAFGVPVRQTDEGTGAHLFQIWLVLEVLAMAFFAINWLSRNPMQTLIILALQVVVALLPLSLVFFLGL